MPLRGKRSHPGVRQFANWLGMTFFLNLMTLGKCDPVEGCQKFFVYKLPVLCYTIPRSVRQADLST